jgi:hypothetical protein
MKLLAPNGKPSNLTPKQYRLVRTPAFKEWFGDWEKAYETGNYDNVSKVIDEVTKEPLVVYHGTTKKFNVFLGRSKSDWQYDNLFFVTPNKDLAKGFAQSGQIGKIRVIPLFVSAKNIFDVDNNKDFLLLKKHFLDSRWEDYMEKSIYEENWTLVEDKEFIEENIIGKYDSIYVYEIMKDYKTHKNLAVLNSNQIKLADGTNTTFDGSNPDIRFGDGGKVTLNKNFKKWFYDNLNEFSVNNKGVPTIWYHARSSDFNTFKKNYAYFAETETYAGQYGDVVQSFYVKCKKTLNLEFVKYDDAYRFETLENWIEKQGGKKEGKDYQIIKNAYSKYTKANPDKSFFLMWEFFSQYNPLAKHFVGWLKKYFDSIYYWEQGKINKNNRSWNKGKILYVFGNEIYKRIKLADGSNTKFDSNNRDIRYGGGGSLTDVNVSYANEQQVNELYDLVSKSNELGNVGHPRLVLIQNNKVIGGIFVDNDYLPYEYMFDIFIKKSKRGKGYSKLLLDAMIKDFVENFPEADQIRGWVINKKLEDYLESKYDFRCADDNQEQILYCYLSKEDAEKLLNNKYFMKGGEITEQDKKETYKKWKDLVNMSASELKKFMDSDEGKEAGLSKQEADKLGIHYGRESAKWILKMKDTPVSEWTPTMWRWAKRQISFNSRMRGNKGKLYDDKGRKTRKHLSLLIWGHNPEKYEMGGGVEETKYGTDYDTYTIANLGKCLKYSNQIIFKNQKDFDKKAGGTVFPIYNSKDKYLGEVLWGDYIKLIDEGKVIDIGAEGLVDDEYEEEVSKYFVRIVFLDEQYADGGELTLTSEQVENKLGRKLHWWKDDVVSIKGIEYKKIFLKDEYKRL